MIAEESIKLFYDTRNPYHKKLAEDVLFAFQQASKADLDGKIKQIVNGSSFSSRVKTLESITRKLNRDGIKDPSNIDDSVEDIIGIRIVTPNKRQARELFDWCQDTSKEWFHEAKDLPKCTPYTIEAKEQSFN